MKNFKSEYILIGCGVFMLYAFFFNGWITNGIHSMSGSETVKIISSKAKFVKGVLGTELKNKEALFSYLLYLVPLSGLIAIIGGVLKTKILNVFAAMATIPGLIYTLYFVVSEIEKSMYGKLTIKNVTSVLEGGFWWAVICAIGIWICVLLPFSKTSAQN